MYVILLANKWMGYSDIEKTDGQCLGNRSDFDEIWYISALYCYTFIITKLFDQISFYLQIPYNNEFIT